MGGAVFPPCCLPWDQTMVEVMKVMATSFKRSHACIAILSAPNPAAGHRRPMPVLDTPGHSWARLGQSLVGSLLLSSGSWFTHGSVCALQESISPVLCKFWQLYVNGKLLQEGLCHTQVYCTQSPCLCGSPLLTHTSAVDTQAQFFLKLCGVSGSWFTQGLCEPSECLWWVWNLTLNVILPLLPSFWVFCFTLGCGVSPQSHSSAYRLAGVSLSLDWGISSQPLQHHSATTSVLVTWKC